MILLWIGEVRSYLRHEHASKLSPFLLLQMPILCGGLVERSGECLEVFSGTIEVEANEGLPARVMRQEPIVLTMPDVPFLAMFTQFYPQAQNWTLDLLKSTPNRRFMKSHANVKDLPVGAAKGLKVMPSVVHTPKSRMHGICGEDVGTYALLLF